MIQGGSHTLGIHPLWRVTHDGPGPINVIYVMAPEQSERRKGVRVGGPHDVRRAARLRMNYQHKIVEIEKVSDHPVCRGDEWLGPEGLIRTTG